MNLRSRSFTRALGIAFATAMLAGSLAGATSAASPAGDVLDADFTFRDDLGQTVVLAGYPFGEPQSSLGSFRVKGPKVSWIESHPDDWGFVGWRVIIETAPTKTGPWSVERKTRLQTIDADTTGKLERFAPRTITFPPTAGTFYVRLTTKLIWFLEDGNGPLGSARHTYTKYGLVPFAEGELEFGDQEKTRSVAPNVYP